MKRATITKYSEITVYRSGKNLVAIVRDLRTGQVTRFVGEAVKSICRRYNRQSR